MAKICFYCGKELSTGEHCDCLKSSSGASNSNSNASSKANNSNKTSHADTAKQTTTKNENKEKERQAKERAREQARRFRETQRAQKPKFDWRSFLFKLATTSGFSANDPLPRKIGYSLIQSILRPVSAIENFVKQQDIRLSMFYVILFSITAGLVSLRFFVFSLPMFLQGFVLGLVIAAILNGLCLLVFRFLSRVKFTFPQILSAFSVPALFMSIFFLFASIGSASLISILLSLITGVVAGALLHFISLKALSRQSTEKLVINVIFIYVLFFSVLGIIFNLLVPVASTI